MDDTFTCAVCGREYVKDRTDEEALAECQAIFGETREDELAVVCEHCWKSMDPHTHPHEVEMAVAATIRARGCR